MKSVEGEKSRVSCLKRAGVRCEPVEDFCDTGPGASALKWTVGEDGTPPLQVRPMLGTEGRPGDRAAASGWYRDDLIAPDFFGSRGLFAMHLHSKKWLCAA